MGVLPIGKLVISMSAPLVASMLFQALYNVVDSMFVARLNQDALNAVSLAFPFQMFVMAFANGTGVGMNALLSRSLGEKNRERASKAANTGIFCFILMSVVFGILGVSCANLFFRLQTANKGIIDYGTAYVTVCIGCSFGLFGQISGERLLQSTGRTDLAMIPQIAGAVFNMIFDPLLIFGIGPFPRLEVQGAAVATLGGQILATVIAYTLNLKKNKEIELNWREIRPHGATIREIYRIGTASILMQAVGSLTNFAINNILIRFTEAATAVYGAYFKLQSFVFLPVLGMNNATVPIVAYNYGAGKAERVKKTTRFVILLAIGIMTAGCLLFELIPATLLKIFSPTEEMISVGRIAFRLIAISFPLAGFCIISGSVCQALGKPLYMLITSLCRQVVALLPTAYLLSLSGRLDMVWLAYPLAEIVSLVLSAIFLKKTMKMLNA